MNVELVKRLFAHFAPAPEVKIDKYSEDGCCPAIIIGPFTISQSLTVVKGLKGDHEVPNYSLDVHVGDGDIIDLATATNFADVVVAAVENYAGWLARAELDRIADDAYAADLESERLALQAAFNEGLEYYRTTAPGERSKDANPYPHGIEHYYKWASGYSQGEAEAVF
jgi:hypothetical protein